MSAGISLKPCTYKHVHGLDQVLIYCTQILTLHCGHLPASQEHVKPEEWHPSPSFLLSPLQSHPAIRAGCTQRFFAVTTVPSAVSLNTGAAIKKSIASMLTDLCYQPSMICFEQPQSPSYTRTPAADTEQGPCPGLWAERDGKWMQGTFAVCCARPRLNHLDCGHCPCGEQVSKKEEWTRKREGWPKLNSCWPSNAHKWYRNTLLEQKSMKRYTHSRCTRAPVWDFAANNWFLYFLAAIFLQYMTPELPEPKEMSNATTELININHIGRNVGMSCSLSASYSSCCTKENGHRESE